MPVDQLHLHSRIRDYTVSFQTDGQFVDELVARSNRLFVVDENVWKTHRDTTLAALPAEDTYVLPIGEELKNLGSVQLIWDQMMSRAAKRNMTVVSIGGGICQDITGFAASTLYRGIGWVFLPTTLLAQADSCIGSKTSLNYGRFKNLLGTFFPPNEVHIFAPFLATQNDLDYFSGLGEVVKLHIMAGSDSAGRLTADIEAIVSRDALALERAVRESLQVKWSYMKDDEFDTGRRNLLNYGHCFGHAIESATEFAIPHGQAVVLGMMFAQDVARTRGLETDPRQKETLDRLFHRALLAECQPESLDVDAVVDAMKHDKKRTGEGLVLVMAADDFAMIKVDDLSESEVRDAVAAVLDVG